MKQQRHNWHGDSTVRIALSTGLLSASAILLAVAAPTKREKAPEQDLYRSQLVERAGADSITALGNYPDTSVLLSGDTTVIPDTAPTNTSRINVSTNTNFKGTFAASPTTGVVTVTDAHPAGSYTVTVTAFGPGGTTTTTAFMLTVTSGIPCGLNQNGFTNAADVNTRPFPNSVAIGDFNGDGKQDLVVVHGGVNTVFIRLGDGLGGFSGSTEVSVGGSPNEVAIGDFNGDGKQDLAVTNAGGAVSIRLGDGLGGFSGSTNVGAGSNPRSVAIGDFNGDGKQDLAVANSGSGTVSIRLGDGLGGFSGSTEVSVGPVPFSVAIGDFNGDGKQDFAVANYDPFGTGTVSIRLGDGLGGFSNSTEVSELNYPRSVAIGDFNNDHKQDLAVANQTDTVSIRLGDGLGGFYPSTEVSVGDAPYSVAIGDFNNDGKQDFAVANNNSDTVSIRLGDGLGGFNGSTNVSVGDGPFSVAIGDFNGDGKQDLAVPNLYSNTVSIRLRGECIPEPTPTPKPTATPQPPLDLFDPNANGTVQVVVVQPDGKILIGGDFTTLAPNGGILVPRYRIARLNPDGTVDSAFNANVNGQPDRGTSVYAIALQADGKILIGGVFETVLGVPRNNIARLNSDGTVDMAFNPNANENVATIAVQADGKILVGGGFVAIGGQSRHAIARLDAMTGLADSFDPHAEPPQPEYTAQVLAIAVQADTKILAGGFFLYIGGQFRNYLARLDATTGLADSFDPDEYWVFSIVVQANGKILVGRNSDIDRRNTDGTLDTTFNPNANSVVNAIAVQADGKILAGGGFYGENSIGGQTRNRIARLDPTTGLADSFDPNANESVYSIAVQADGKMLIGGDFTTLAPNGQPAVTRNRIARLETDGSLPSPTPIPTPHPPHVTPTPRPHATPTPRPPHATPTPSPHVTPTPRPPHATTSPMQKGQP